MELFLPDRISTQPIVDLSKQYLDVLPYDEEVDNHQWVFEVCTILPKAKREMSHFALIDAFIDFMELNPPNKVHESNFREIDQEEAKRILTYILSQTLAYSHSTTLSGISIASIIEQLFRTFSTQPHYFTNGEFDLNPFRLSSSYPITTHTFDTGIILIDEQRIGILWAIDED